MRTIFSKSLLQLAQTDSKVMLLTGDHGYALFDEFRNLYPKQYINAGVAEQNMVGVAAGLARSGFFPVVYGLSAFVPIRVLEQIKLDVAHDGLHVLFVGDGAGFVYSHLGTSHQSTEDIACTRAIPGLSIYSPADRQELAHCMQWAYQNQSTAYLRIGKADRGDVHGADFTPHPGKLQYVRKGQQSGGIAFVATGSMVATALALAEAIFRNASVWSAPCIKPLDSAQVAAVCSAHRALVVMEEHSIHAGLGGLIAEIAAEHSPTKILRIGVNDKFSDKCGDYEYLLAEHGLDLPSIAARITEFLSLELN